MHAHDAPQTTPYAKPPVTSARCLAGAMLVALVLFGWAISGHAIIARSTAARSHGAIPPRPAHDHHARQAASSHAMRAQDAMTNTWQNPIFMPIATGTGWGDLLIAAAHIDSAVSYEPDEAILLWNVGERAQSLAGWQLAAGSKSARFPLTSTLTLAPGQRLWCAAEAVAFRSSFGEDPACEWKSDTDPQIPNLDAALQLPNSGGWIQLRAPDGTVIDTLLYGTETDTIPGWSGMPAQLYARGAVPSAGQVWQRKRDPLSGLPIDTDQASDWAGDLGDLDWGRRVRLPGWRGWDAADLSQPPSGSAHAHVTVAVGPEGLYAPLAAAFDAATHSIDLSIYTFEHPEMMQVLLNALGRGVRIRMLLEGSPPGGIDDVQRWAVMQLAAAGADIVYLSTTETAPNGYRERYRYTHAKYGIIDGRVALVGTDNFNRDSMPVGEDEAELGGRRGVYILTDAPPVVAALQDLFARDRDASHFLDLRPYEPTDPKFGAPPADFELPTFEPWAVESAPFREPVTLEGFANFSIISAPENALRPDTGLMQLIHQAGPGDEIHLTQLYEHKYWGESASNPVADPNVRLFAIVEAARRGARVRILLDAFFDDADDLRSNRATVEYVQTVAAAEGLDMQARLGNPTAGGIHAKLVLLRVDGVSWSAVGSLNGGEISHKLNREVVLLTDMAGVYQRLMEVFEYDWAQP